MSLICWYTFAYLSDVAVSFFLERELFTKLLRRLKLMLILLHKICNKENIQINCVTDGYDNLLY